MSYTWDIGAFGTITSGQGTNTITVDWIAQGPSSNVYVTVVDDMGCEAIAEIYVEECCKYDNPVGALNIYETDYCGAMFLSDFIADIQASPTFSGTISGSSITTTDVLMINNELIADINYTFENCPNIIFAPNAKITVEDVKLSFISTGGQPALKTALKAKCGQPWDGIYTSIPVNSELVFDRTYVSDAKNIIVSENGALYKVSRSLFENNNIGIIAKNFNSTTNSHPGVITSTTIQTNPMVPNLFPDRGKYGVLIQDIGDITVGTNAGIGQFNTFKNLDFGIFINNSNVQVYRNDFLDIDNIGAANVNDYFDKGVAIYAVNRVFPQAPFRTLTVGDGTLLNRNNVTRCGTGVYAVGRYNGIVDRNQMNQIDIAGVVLRNTNGANHLVKNNFITLDKGFIAIYLWSIPGSTARVEFNNINSQGNPNTKGTAGIAADAIGATFNTDLEINNNTVQHSDYGILVYTVPNAKIRNNTITRNITNVVAENYGQNIYGIQVVFSAGAIIENNLVNRMATNSFPTAANPNLNLIGIHAENSPEVQIFENTINRWGKGIQAKDVNSNSDMYCNTFSKNYHGFFLDNAETGNQGVNLPGTANDRAQDNKFNLGVSANVNPNRIAGSSSIPNTTWYYRSPAPMYDISNSVNNNAFQTNSMALPMSTLNICENGPIGPGGNIGPKSLLRQQKFAPIVNEAKNFTNLQLYARYMDHLYAMREFDRDSTWLVTGDVSDSLYLSYFNTRYQGNDGKICSMATDWEHGNYTALATKTAALNTSCFYTQNIKTVNEIFLATWANDVYELDAAQQQIVLDLACSEAHDNGPGVYAARALIGFFAACDNGFIKSTTEMQGDVAEIEHSENGVSIYPNPSAGLFSVTYDLEETETAELSVMSITGKVVYLQRMAQQENTMQLDLQHLSNGIYLYQMVTDKGIVATGRLVINK